MQCVEEERETDSDYRSNPLSLSLVEGWDLRSSKTQVQCTTRSFLRSALLSLLSGSATPPVPLPVNLDQLGFKIGATDGCDLSKES